MNTLTHTEPQRDHRCILTMSSKAGGRDQTLPQRLLPLVWDGPMISEDATLQLVQVGSGKLHTAPRTVPVLIVTPLLTHKHTHT